MRRRHRKHGQELIRRGEILIDPEVLQAHQHKEKKPGRPYKYPKALILFILFLKNTLGLSYRQAEDLVKKLLNQLETSVQLPNFRTLQYRHAKEGLQFDSSLQDLKGDFMVIVGPTGIRLTSSEEWPGEKHDEERKKSWIKLNLIVDAGNYKLLDINIASQKAPEGQGQ